MIGIDNYIYLSEKDKKITSVGFSKKEIKNHKGISGLKYYLIILYLRKHVQTFGQIALTLNDLLQEIGYSTKTNNKSIYSDFREIIKTELINKGYASCNTDIFVVKPNDLFYLQLSYESGITYNNTKKDYATMDNKFSKSRMGIGYSSNLAQLAMTYYWTELQKDNPDEKKLKELYDNFIILSVLAQVIIDGCKREYEIDGNKEIDRISKLPCMNIKRIVGYTESGKPKYKKYDFPEFMKYTREIKYTKDGKELPQDEIDESKNKLKSRINGELLCPMNWLEDWINKIQNASTSDTIPVSNFFIKMHGRGHDRQMTKIMSIIVEYDNYVKTTKLKYNDDSETCSDLLVAKSKDVVEQLQKIKIGNIVTINRLIEVALSLDTGVGNSKKISINPSKYTRKVLNLLYKMNKDKFLLNFK